MTTPETSFVAEPGSHDVTSSAVIDAPLDAVYRAYVDPELFVRWWGPAELTSKIERWEPETGGSWRVVHVDPDGNEYGFRGVYHDVVPAERIVMTFEFEGMPGHVALETHTFEAVEGGTRVTQHAVYQSVADRDGMNESGAAEFAPVGMAQLQDVARSVAAG